MSPFSSSEIRLTSRPEGMPTPEDFSIDQVAHGELEPGQVRVSNEFISVDPYMRGRMRAGRSYVKPYGLGETITGGAVGRVVQSAADDLPEGTAVLHQHGWTDAVQDDASTFQAVPELEGLPLSLYLGLLGMPGLTAYVGLTRVAELRPGDSVFVSGAAGAVGTAVGQIARQLGAARLIGSAGSAEKVALLKDKYGFDVALNYRDAPIREQLVDALGHEGVDVFYDNVGGDHLEAALEVMNDFGRLALCGAISGYNATERPAGPDNMGNMVTRRLRMQGFIVAEVAAEHPEVTEEFRERMSGWLSAGDVTSEETVVEGLEHTVDAFLDMMRGGNTGKMVVRVG
ncbi:NADP-dependent oxidoreductase [Citricoccus sp. K5]|uniref:NADP-dependent oxidoreductase n=1 Tax=Citricoccus sp. K5 TaxID=2653135 RepID=UPI0012F1CCCE|nr:NADP-dependent oxidoreductase [Citricoccus sp. K5]VXB47798.1 Putative NADP-dependent oxidoreductase YfmJ [Citricoccus sp. K5]